MLKLNFQHHCSSLSSVSHDPSEIIDLLLKKHFLSLLMVKTAVLLIFVEIFFSGFFDEQKVQMNRIY